MDPVVIIAGLILFAMVVYLVGSPLFRKEDTPEFDWEPEDSGESTKTALFTALAEIEFDYKMGKMSEEDYRELKQTYQPEAVALLQKEESQVSGKRRQSTTAGDIEQELEKELERELAEIRRQAKKEQER
ncbi:MAG: hypothetical protein GX262_13155 [Clostridia bacterium]|nr:hypothetical protein [Clostridia bacterium]